MLCPSYLLTYLLTSLYLHTCTLRLMCVNAEPRLLWLNSRLTFAQSGTRSGNWSDLFEQFQKVGRGSETRVAERDAEYGRSLGLGHSATINHFEEHKLCPVRSAWPASLRTPSIDGSRSILPYSCHISDVSSRNGPSASAVEGDEIVLNR